MKLHITEEIIKLAPPFIGGFCILLPYFHTIQAGHSPPPVGGIVCNVTQWL